jgi:hypothetical protein
MRPGGNTGRQVRSQFVEHVWFRRLGPKEYKIPLKANVLNTCTLYVSIV